MVWKNLDLDRKLRLFCQTTIYDIKDELALMYLSASYNNTELTKAIAEIWDLQCHYNKLQWGKKQVSHMRSKHFIQKSHK